jgi:C4-dicarboxylate transporter, DctQ subunit
MLSRAFNRLEEGLIAFLLALMTLVTFVQVVLRYVFNAGFIWALEATTYLFAWLVLIGISYGVKSGAHIGVDVFVGLLPRRGKQVAGVIAGLLSILYAVLLLIGSWQYFELVRMIGVTAEDLPIQRWILVIILPIGFGLLLVRLVQSTWSILRGEEVGLRLVNQAAEAMKHREDFDGRSLSARKSRKDAEE